MKIKEIRLIDRKQMVMVLSIQRELLEMFEKIQISCPGIGSRTKSNRSITVKVYEENKYDYKEIAVKYIETGSLSEYLIFILYCLQDEKRYKRNIASLEKRYIFDLVESSNCNNFYIHGNELHSAKSDDCIGLNYIEKINYSKTDKLMTVTVCGDEKYKIDFINETIEFIDESEK